MKLSQKTISLLLVLLVAFIDYMGIGLVYPTFSSMIFHTDFELLPLDTSTSIRGLYLGFLLAAMPTLQFFSAPFLGLLSDQKGRKKILLLSLTIGVLGYGLCFVSVLLKNVFALILSRVVVGVSAGSVAIVAAAIADLSNTESKGKNFGFYGMACGVGFMAGPPIGGILSECNFFGMVGYATPFLFAGVLTLLNLVLVAFWFHETLFLLVKKKLNLSTGIQNIKKAFQLKDLSVVILCVFIFSFGWSFFYEFAPVTWIASYNISPTALGLLYTFAAGFYALSSGLLIRYFIKKFKDQVLLFYCLLFSGLYILLLLLQLSYFWLWFYLPLLQFFVSILFPLSTTIVSNATDEKSQGEMLGILQSVQSAAYSLSPLTSGSLLGLTVNMPIIVSGFSMLFGAVIIGFFLRKMVFTSKIFKPKHKLLP
ncbi:MAG: MFS transporter [Chlamydiae bacterium]|nr:MFS transporter [Chlamydiota bacterium]